MASPSENNAVEIAVAYVSIVGETDKLGRDIKKELRDAQKFARSNPLQLKVNSGELRREVRELGGLHANVELRSTAAARNSFVADLNQKLRDRRILVHLTPVVDERALRRRLDSLPEGAVRLRLDVTNAELNRFTADLRNRLRNADFTIPVRLDLTNDARFRQRLDALTRNRSVRADVDQRGSSGSASLGSGSSLSGLGKGAGAAVAGIGAIGGAAGAALGAVGALGVGIAALGPAAVAAGATVAVGLQGVGDAFKALSAAEESAGSDAQAQAKAVAAAQEQVASALENVESAQRELSDAQKDARDATNDIAQAYKDAANELEDYQFKLKDASLSEQEAALALREARDELAKALPADREKAFLRLQRAELRYSESVENNRDVQEEAAQAQAKGIEGSDKVVAAKDRAAQADQRVADAERQLTKAHEQVSKAQQAVTDAASSGSAAQDKAAQALAKLSPNAQAFVLATRDLAPAWEELTHAVQDSLFDGAAKGITDLANKALPMLKTGMVDVASSMNGLTKEFAAFWSAPQNLEGVRAAFAGTANFIDGLGPGLQQATQGFLSLGQAFEPVANKVGAQFAGMLGQIGQAFTDAFQDGSLTTLISTFGDMLAGLGAGLNPLIDGLIQVGNIVGPTLGPLFQTLGESLGSLAPAFGQIGATFATTLTALLPDLTKFIDALLVGLEPVLPVIGDLLRSLMNALTPIIEPLSRVAQVIGTALAQAIEALAPAMGPLANAFASLITAVSPIIPVVAQLISMFVQAFAPALQKIFDALAPVIQSIAEQLQPVFDELAPILAEVAGTIGQAIADALVALAPIIPPIVQAFGRMLLALTPILPALAEMIVKLLPPLTDLLIELAPVIVKLIDALTWLINNVIIPLVIPYIERMTEIWANGMEMTVNAVRDAKDYLGKAFTKVGEFLTDLRDTVSAVWNGIVTVIAKSVKKIGELLQKVPSVHIPGTDITVGDGISGMGDKLVEWANAHGAATGGYIRGPGTGTSDSIPVMLSNGEYVVNAASTARTLPLLEAINSGWVPSPEFLHGMVPGFAQGGLVAGKKFAESMDSATYLMGGFSRSSIDCSGMVAATINDALGLDPFSGRMSTINEGQWLADKGALPGLGGPGDISIGWFDRGGGANGHTALTLGDGTNVESRGGDGVVVGAGAAGADDPMFDQHMHIPKELLLGGDLGGPATGAIKGGRPSKLGGSTGKSGGSGGTGGGLGGGAGVGGPAASTDGAATPVFVTNWPQGYAAASPSAQSLGGTPASMGNGPSTPVAPDVSTYQPTPPTGGGTHPLANLPVPGAAELFDGPAPWYMAPTPEAALANLGTQAAGLATKTGEDLASFFQNNWQEMLNSGLAVAGMAAGGGGPQMIVNNTGMDPNSAAAAVERQWRRRTIAAQRGGGFSR